MSYAMTDAAREARAAAGRASWDRRTDAEKAAVLARLRSHSKPRYYMTPQTAKLVLAIRTAYDQKLPRVPLAVLARLCGYTGKRAEIHVCIRIGQLKKHGVIPEAWWPKHGQPNRRIWRRGAELDA